MINDINQVSQLADLYRNKPGELQKRYQMSRNLIDLLALQKIKSEKDAAARQMEMQMQNAPGTIKQQREKELLDRTRSEMMNVVRSTLAQKEAERRKRMERMEGIAGQASRPMNFRKGGIVGFFEGGDTARADIEAWKKENPERAAKLSDYQISMILSSNKTGEGLSGLLRSVFQLDRRGYGKPKAEPQQSAGGANDVGVIDGMTGADDATGERPPIEPVTVPPVEKWGGMPPPAAEQQETSATAPGTAITGRPNTELEEVTLETAKKPTITVADDSIDVLTRDADREFDPYTAAEKERARSTDVYGLQEFRDQRAADRARYERKLAQADKAAQSRSGIWNMLANMGGYGYIGNAAKAGVAALNETQDAQRGRISAAEKALQDFDKTTESGMMSRIEQIEASGRDARNFDAEREAARDRNMRAAAELGLGQDDAERATQAQMQATLNTKAQLAQARNIAELKGRIDVYVADQTQELRKAIQEAQDNQRLFALDAEIIGQMNALKSMTNPDQVALNSGKLNATQTAELMNEINAKLQPYRELRALIRREMGGPALPTSGGVNTIPQINADMSG